MHDRNWVFIRACFDNDRSLEQLDIRSQHAQVNAQCDCSVWKYSFHMIVDYQYVHSQVHERNIVVVSIVVVSISVCVCFYGGQARMVRFAKSVLIGEGVEFFSRSQTLPLYPRRHPVAVSAVQLHYQQY